MPRMTQTVLTPAQAKRLHDAGARIDAARVAWAELVRELGISASARELGVTPAALGERIKRIEGRAEHT